MRSAPPALVRLARPEEYAAVGELTVRAYAADGHGSPSYAARLRDAAGRAAAGTLLVATREEAHRSGDDLSPLPADGYRLLGTVSLFAAGAEHAQLAGPGETEIRMLAVDPAARGRGVGAALAAACVERSSAAGAAGIRLSTEDDMTAAHRIYERLGFRRTPERDWSPVPGASLLTYALRLGGAPAYCDRCGGSLDAGAHADCAAARRLEPPRYCRDCARRLVVQVTPLGWNARCARHRERSGDQPDLA